MNALEIRNLNKSFGAFTVIRDLTLSIAAGERHALIGPNGAGKTTLLNLLTGWSKPSGGAILLNGSPIPTGRPAHIARSGMSRSFQKNLLLGNLTVFENLRIACQTFDSSRRSLFARCTHYQGVIQRARMAAERMQLDTVLDRNVNDLSYGQQRQLEVALALCAEPKILLMDEPAAGTSPRERLHLIELIRALSPELTMILVEHDMDVVFSVCARITVLSYGTVIATGSRDEIRANEEVRNAYLGRHYS